MKISAAGIGRILPHRYPMLLVDRVTELVAGTSVTAVKAVTRNEPWYERVPADADDEVLAYPPVLLLESWCQAAGILSTWHEPNPDVCTGNVMLFGNASHVRFVRPVQPGDLVIHQALLSRMIGDTAIFEGASLVDGEPVMTVGRMVMTFRSAEHLHRDAPSRVPAAGAATAALVGEAAP